MNVYTYNSGLFRETDIKTTNTFGKKLQSICYLLKKHFENGKHQVCALEQLI